MVNIRCVFWLLLCICYYRCVYAVVRLLCMNWALLDPFTPLPNSVAYFDEKTVIGLSCAQRERERVRVSCPRKRLLPPGKFMKATVTLHNSIRTRCARAEPAARSSPMPSWVHCEFGWVEGVDGTRALLLADWQRWLTGLVWIQLWLYKSAHANTLYTSTTHGARYLSRHCARVRICTLAPSCDDGVFDVDGDGDAMATYIESN